MSAVLDSPFPSRQPRSAEAASIWCQTFNAHVPCNCYGSSGLTGWAATGAVLADLVSAAHRNHVCDEHAHWQAEHEPGYETQRDTAGRVDTHEETNTHVGDKPDNRQHRNQRDHTTHNQHKPDADNAAHGRPHNDCRCSPQSKRPVWKAGVAWAAQMRPSAKRAAQWSGGSTIKRRNVCR